jgi:hypothetical protein
VIRLPKEIESAVRRLAQEEAAGGGSVSWQALGGAARQALLQRVAELLLGEDAKVVGASLLQVLADGRVTPDEWRGVLGTWAAERVQDHDKLALLADGLGDGRLSREEVIAAVAAWAQTRTGDAAPTTLLQTLRDGTLTPDELLGALTRTAGALGADSEVAGALGKALADGRVTRDEALGVLAAWVRRQSPEPALEPVFAALADGATQETLDPERASALLGAVAERLEVTADEVAGIDAGGAVVALAAWAAASDEDARRAAAAAAAMAAQEDPLAVLEAWLPDALPAEARALLRSLGKDDWLAVVSAVLGTLETGLGARLLQIAAGGRLRDLAETKLTDLLERAGLEHAGTVAEALLDVVTGARSLFAESAEPGLTDPAEIALWREIRSVIYIAQLATFGGQIVATEAQARPHVFQAAAIRYDSRLDSLVPKKATKTQTKELCNLLTAFLDEHFGPRMRRRFGEDGILALAVEDLAPAQGAPAPPTKGLFRKIKRRLL